jgi:hypothetical protein
MEKPQPAERPARKKSAGTTTGSTAVVEDDKPAAGTVGDLIREKLAGKLDLNKAKQAKEE